MSAARGTARRTASGSAFRPRAGPYHDDVDGTVTFVMLFAIATAVAIGARWLKVPYTVALVLTGLALGSLRVVEAPALTQELLYSVFLPGLVFEAAFHLDADRFWASKGALIGLAIPGLAFAIVLTAAALAPLSMLTGSSGLGFGYALLFASLIAATDPIAVTAMFRTLRVPRRLLVLVEGESLLNDGTAIVVFTIVLEAVTGGSAALAPALLRFVTVVATGMFIGLGVGYGCSKLLQRVDDAMIEITLTTIAAYGSFALAERFHSSGVIATVSAGMLCGNFGTRVGVSASTRIAIESFWEYVAFAMNSVVFLLIGFQVHVSDLAASWQLIVAAWIAMTAGRAAMIFLATALLSRTRERISWSWATVLTWGGLRGALSMVLVLGLPPNFPNRELLVTMTFGVVLISILGQGLSMRVLLRRLGLTRTQDRLSYELERGALLAATAARLALARRKLESEGSLESEVLSVLEREYEKKVRDADVRVRHLHDEHDEFRDEEIDAMRRHLLTIEKDQLADAFRRGVIGADARDTLVARIDSALAAIDERSERRSLNPAE